MNHATLNQLQQPLIPTQRRGFGNYPHKEDNYAAPFDLRNVAHSELREFAVRVRNAIPNSYLAATKHEAVKVHRIYVGVVGETFYRGCITYADIRLDREGNPKPTFNITSPWLYQERKSRDQYVRKSTKIDVAVKIAKESLLGYTENMNAKVYHKDFVNCVDDHYSKLKVMWGRCQFGAILSNYDRQKEGWKQIVEHLRATATSMAPHVLESMNVWEKHFAEVLEHESLGQTLYVRPHVNPVTNEQRFAVVDVNPSSFDLSGDIAIYNIDTLPTELRGKLAVLEAMPQEDYVHMLGMQDHAGNYYLHTLKGEYNV
jgi:hypothetical protein